jgi:hypothetical protein
MTRQDDKYYVKSNSLSPFQCNHTSQDQMTA